MLSIFCYLRLRQDFNVTEPLEKLLDVNLRVRVVNRCVNEVSHRHVQAFHEVLALEQPFLQEERVDCQSDQVVPICLRLAESIVDDVACDHVWFHVIRLADVLKFARCVLFVLALDEFHNQVFDLKFDLLARFLLIVVLKIESDYIINIDRSSPIN